MKAIEEHISGIVDQLLADGEVQNSIDNKGMFNHPDKDIIIDILMNLVLKKKTQEQIFN